MDSTTRTPRHLTDTDICFHEESHDLIFAQIGLQIIQI
jgi:hypothetical protein